MKLTFPFFFEEGVLPGLPEGEYPVTVEVHTTAYFPANRFGPEEGGDWGVGNGVVHGPEGKEFSLYTIKDSDVCSAYVDGIEKASKEFWEKNHEQNT